MSDVDYRSALELANRDLAEAEKSLTAIASTKVAEPLWWSVTNAMTISVAVLTFGLIICLLAAYLLREEKNTDNVLKTLGTLLIIVSALFLVVAGYSDQQIAPVMGLLGTIAGYLLGKTSEKKQP